MTLSARVSRDSYDYVCQGGSTETKGYIDKLIIDNYTTHDGVEHGGREIGEDTLFYSETLRHFMKTLYKPIDGIGNSLKVIAKRKRN